MTRTSRACHALLFTLLAGLIGCGDDGEERSEIERGRTDAGDSSVARPPTVRPTDERTSDAGQAADAGKTASDEQRQDASTSRDGAPDASVAVDAGRADAGPVAKGDGGALVDTVVEATIVVKAGESFDGAGKRFIAGRALGDGSQSESQQPVFKLEDGAKLTNVVIGAPAADGIHTHGDVILENIVWQDIGEDALTIKDEGTVELRGGAATEGEDKIFQINAASVFRLSDFRASNAGKLIRQNGGTTFKVEVFIERCDISNMDEAIFRTDSELSTVSMTNSRHSKIGDSLFIGVSAANIVQRDNTEY